MGAPVEQLKDGKLPPDVWMGSEKWYAEHQRHLDPSAAPYFEVMHARHADIAMTTVGKSGVEYVQYFRRTPEQSDD